VKVNAYSDGGSRGNPGPAAAAFLILGENNEVLKTQSRFLGIRTNNQAEYEALIAALEAAILLGAEETICHLDSELVCRHLTGEYRVKNADLRKLWGKVQDLKRCFKLITYTSVPRTNRYIQKVDQLVNERLDEATK
jgi:ribonuclease HI/probable phosphoglycerate mutase